MSPPDPMETEMQTNNPPTFPTIRFSSFDRMARVNQRGEFDALSFELVEGVWCLPAHVAADAMQASK